MNNKIIIDRKKNVKRCLWAKDDLMKEYHDKEWGKPKHDDRVLFEFLILEGAQAGLSWSTILKRREGYRRSFSNFNPQKISKYDLKKIDQLMKNPKIIRNKKKILSAINNSKQFLKIKKKFGSFDNFIWGFVDKKPIINHFRNSSEIPAYSLISLQMSKDLKNQGFSFVGPTICYAFMQAIGMVNDHEENCYFKNG